MPCQEDGDDTSVGPGKEETNGLSQRSSQSGLQQGNHGQCFAWLKFACSQQFNLKTHHSKMPPKRRGPGRKRWRSPNVSHVPQITQAARRHSDDRIVSQVPERRRPRSTGRDSNSSSFNRVISSIYNLFTGLNMPLYIILAILILILILILVIYIILKGVFINFKNSI